MLPQTLENDAFNTLSIQEVTFVNRPWSGEYI